MVFFLREKRSVFDEIKGIYRSLDSLEKPVEVASLGTGTLLWLDLYGDA